jgi:hypothetical protein
MLGPRAELASFPIAPAVRAKLLKAGFKNTDDLDGVSALELAKGVLSRPIHEL